MMLLEFVTGTLILIILTYIVELARGFGDDAREPKRLRSRIPLIGHVLGLLHHGPAYYNLTSMRTNNKMYALDLINVKMYVCNDPNLVPLVTKAHKTISFTPFVKVAAERIAGNSRHGCDLFDGPLLYHFSHSIKTTLSPGLALDEMNLRTGQSTLLEIDALLENGKTKPIQLLEWARQTVIQASSSGVFGSGHPFLDPKVQKAFWEWQVYLPAHIAGLDIMKKAERARSIVHKSLVDYCAVLPNDVSEVVREQQRVLKEAGMSFEDAAKQESSFCVAIFGNTAPTLFWTIYELFSRPVLLSEVREEIATNAIVREAGQQNGKEDDVSRFKLDVAALRTKCPLLLASFQEVQRMHDAHANIRKVLADTLLDDGRYLLRKENYCLIPSSLMHQSTQLWGESANVFDPYRFQTSKHGQCNAKKSSTMPQASSFLSWGTPPHLCPARQYAATEILVVTALVAMRVDLVPTANGGQWGKDLAVHTGDLVSVFNPKDDVEVDMKPREAALGKWTIDMGASKTRVALLSG